MDDCGSQELELWLQARQTMPGRPAAPILAIA
jgi:hypothetical protein